MKKTEVIEMEADKTASLIADVGGTLGVWLGMSLITCVDLRILPGKTVFVPTRLQKSGARVATL